MYEYIMQIRNHEHPVLTIADEWLPHKQAIIFLKSGVEVYRIDNWRDLINMKRRPI